MSIRRKSSSQVTLVLAGAAALAGCSREPAGSGKRYASQAECVADWGTPEDCKEDVSTRNGQVGHSWLYYGAGSALLRNGFMGSRSVAPAAGVSAPTSETPARSVSRGGFGTTGRTGAAS